MALTRAQLLSGNSSQGTVLPGQVQGVSQGAGVLIAANGQISVDASTTTGLVKLNNPSAYNAYVWPNTDGTVGQQLATDGSGNLSWTDPDSFPWTAKGQLVVGTGVNTETLLNVGVDGSILIADSTQASGLRYTSNFVATTGPNASAIMPAGATAQRDPAPSAGYTRFNTTDGSLEVYNGTAWSQVGAIAGGLGVDITDDVAKGYTQTSSAPPAVGTLPTEAIDGSTYWDDNLGVLFIYYNDGTSSQWVQAIPG